MASSLDDGQIIIKNDWYQSETHIILAILGKHLSKEDCFIVFNKDELTIKSKFATGQSYTLNLKLSKNIVPERCSFKLLSSKLEILLAKTNAERWDVLERPLCKPNENSKCQGRNWDKLVNDMTKDDTEEDVNSLFRKIYLEGSDEVRKAMNKSFVESNGTVLSTNWKDVANDKVEIKPPEGMEWKAWNK
ncbi:CS domain,HSP20-like chaperone,SGS domain [Cinara cedri]|uniref:CS domain,HSP20-like chaperone,SGS domain n=1 Tax=Cinara cedri TaxID=506608 RepID=A0A5E4N7U2_9HEMI|nr:CS domain,HSP20-like chaperone,SGS domain [Cinara cedri]